MKNKLFTVLALTVLCAFNSPLSAAFAQGTVFTYQGRVTDNGTNFSGAGQFQFALVTSTNLNHPATATANIPSGGFITGYVVTSGGSGYVTPPAVTVTGGGGAGATATATLSGGAVTQVNVATPGNGLYTNTPTVLIAPPPANILYTTYWSNDGTSSAGSEPAAPLSVAVTNGLFTIVLGDTTIPNMTAISASLFNQPNLQLRIWFNDGVNGFAVLSPVQNLTPTPYAITAVSLAGVVQNNTLATGEFSTISGGSGNFIPNGADHATVSGGGGNSASGGGGTVAGGNNNTVSNYNSTISGGANNVSSGSASTVSGGSENWTAGDESTIGGGQHNINKGDHSVIGGGESNYIETNVFYSIVGGGRENTNLTSASVIAGGYYNQIMASSTYSTIGGGYFNQIQTNCSFSFIGGGINNTIQTNSDRSTIGGGQQNQIFTNTSYSTIGGGYNNQIQPNASLSTIGGGQQNQIQTNANNSTIGGGYLNQSQTGAVYSTIGGGYFNAVNGAYATVPGGAFNFAGGQYSFAAGQRAQAAHDGSFVWADSQNATFSSTRSNQFNIRAGGGVVINVSGSAGLNPSAVAISSTSANGIGLVVNESSSDTAALFANNGTGDILKGLNNGNTVFEVLSDGTVRSKGITLTSDRNTKENFAALDGKAVLAKVISMPLTEWNYKDDPASKKHMGPMAQDFYEAFKLDGTDDKHISVVDEGGVALAAIQGLNEKLDEKDAEIKNLEQKLDKLQAVVKQLAARK